MRDLFRKMFAAAALLYAGCATVPQPQMVGMLSADELKAHLDRTAAVSGAFTAEGTITVNSPSMNQSAGFDLFTRGGDSVKMAVYGPFGITVGTALFTRTEFTAYNALNNTVYRGNPERQMKMLPFIKDIPFELLIGSLQGKHPLLPAAEIDSITVTASRSYTFTSIVSDSVVDRFTVDGDLLRIIKCSRRTSAGAVLWRVEYTYTKRADGTVVPELVEVFIPAKESSLSIEYSSVSYEPTAGPLTVTFPDDAEIITIE